MLHHGRIYLLPRLSGGLTNKVVGEVLLKYGCWHSLAGKGGAAWGRQGKPKENGAKKNKHRPGRGSNPGSPFSL